MYDDVTKLINTQKQEQLNALLLNRNLTTLTLAAEHSYYMVMNTSCGSLI